MTRFFLTATHVSRFGLVGLLAFGGCMPASYRQAKRMENQYQTGSPGVGWVAVSPGGADRAWYNASLTGSIYTDSNCGTHYRELRLPDLALESLAGLRDTTTLKVETPTVDGRAGLLRVTTGQLDGVAVTVANLVSNKDACTFDLNYVAPAGRFDAGWDAYQTVIVGFVAHR
ncbi:MAG: hypothetical protein EXR69_02050 [Myxococcales bacterium]|nr:hypothetical protein [Myxococcales bacterium]